jgi:hypothetical protein
MYLISRIFPSPTATAQELEVFIYTPSQVANPRTLLLLVLPIAEVPKILKTCYIGQIRR